MKRAGLEAVNAMVFSNSAMLAWKASKATSPINGIFKSMIPNGSTRSKAAGKLEIPSSNIKNLAVWNMATAWNTIPDLRVAKSEGRAKKIVRKFVRSLPI